MRQYAVMTDDHDELHKAIRAMNVESFDQLAVIADELEAKALFWTTPRA